MGRNVIDKPHGRTDVHHPTRLQLVVAQIQVTPSNDGLPGAAFWQKVLGWLAWGGLAGSLASMLIGGAVWGLSYAGGQAHGVSRGKTFALGGMAGAILVGLAATIVNTLSGIA